MVIVQVAMDSFQHGQEKVLIVGVQGLSAVKGKLRLAMEVANHPLVEAVANPFQLAMVRMAEMLSRINVVKS
ncbi:hypothetical protein RRG08_061683 [Elysia crispata]|uniref:Uncharacterized protein n=1 Tax=Elysia crispata TaxID=231223 RepID=A0AAE1DE87_9GAST|nr:hypothetical protein RRG08_061683 [Elysia crispata]